MPVACIVIKETNMQSSGVKYSTVKVNTHLYTRNSNYKYTSMQFGTQPITCCMGSSENKECAHMVPNYLTTITDQTCSEQMLRRWLVPLKSRRSVKSASCCRIECGTWNSERHVFKAVIYSVSSTFIYCVCVGGGGARFVFWKF